MDCCGERPDLTLGGLNALVEEVFRRVQKLIEKAPQIALDCGWTQEGLEYCQKAVQMGPESLN